jgi:dTDP-4-amino-4,6-dideoxygalactose transaminase
MTASIPFNCPTLSDREAGYVAEVLASRKLSGDGPFTARCVSRIISDIGAAHALITHSGTAALEMAAILCDLEPGDEVVMPSYTFVSTANAVVLRGAIPVFVDIDPRTMNIEPGNVEAAVTARTKAIFAVHYAGVPADMDALSVIAEAHGLMLVEDAAQAYGSTYKGRHCGTLGDMAAFSFHETKNVVAGEGGALVVNRPDLVKRSEIIWEKGTNRREFNSGLVAKYQWVDFGSSFLPCELVSAVLLAQLEAADALNAERKKIFAKYMAAFSSLATDGLLRLPHCPEGSEANGHMFYVVLPEPDMRAAFIAHMAAAGIVTPFHYVPLHSAPAGLRFGRTSGSLEATDHCAARLVRLPLFAHLDDGADKVIDAAVAFFETARSSVN